MAQTLLPQHFRSVYAHGFARVAACTGRSHPADPERNADAVLALAETCHGQGVAVAVFPELALSAYAIEDLLLQATLLNAVEAAAARLIAASAGLRPLLIVGAPVRWRNRIYNAALVIQRGQLLGIVPKIHLPNYREFYEKRHFASGAGIAAETIRFAGHDAPFGADQLFSAEDVPGLIVGIEICEDLWVPDAPGMHAALAGATVLANLSGSPITVGRAESRALLSRAASMRGLCAYVYAAAGLGESTTDLSWDGQTSIDENGVRLAEGERFSAAPVVTLADIDLDLLAQERLQDGSFDDNARAGAPPGLSPRPLPPRSADGRSRIDAPDRAVSVRAGRSAAASPRIATRPTTSRSRDSPSAWRPRARERPSSAFPAAWIPPMR